ncbi:potassium channel family protein [Polynucleobacter necessarius]|uniref:potassium channel family protein n=1 Tax=Polynucleobacter necessarius TaxID=576610 RepID=UPI0022B2616A|nr:potassium channel family protein [Polynucleobacter necessarius]
MLDTFFFSVQTMATIGYGRMTPIGSWPNAIVTVEAFFGIVYSALTTGLAFARFTRPTAGVRFSKKWRWLEVMMACKHLNFELLTIVALILLRLRCDRGRL